MNKTFYLHYTRNSWRLYSWMRINLLIL